MSQHRSFLSRARGLGASGTGVDHWWMQRLSAVANLFLTLGVLTLLVMQTGKSYLEVQACLSGLVPTVILILFVGSTFFHAALGLQVVIEDYVHARALHLFLMFKVRFGLTILALASILMILKNFFEA